MTWRDTGEISSPIHQAPKIDFCRIWLPPKPCQTVPRFRQGISLNSWRVTPRQLYLQYMLTRWLDMKRLGVGLPEGAKESIWWCRAWPSAWGHRSPPTNRPKAAGRVDLVASMNVDAISNTTSPHWGAVVVVAAARLAAGSRSPISLFVGFVVANVLSLTVVLVLRGLTFAALHAGAGSVGIPPSVSGWVQSRHHATLWLANLLLVLSPE
ncbi:hypothetical protein Taro_038299 [Colocasia esculenta]|uniref:Uncharacterized protein n=1 Tax=Colocasia esculenta TaxID=4460 RepID=A0A843WFG3_COLES|nr:hypothetical protein [Colocasia esculenta]